MGNRNPEQFQEGPILSGMGNEVTWPSRHFRATAMSQGNKS